MMQPAHSQTKISISLSQDKSVIVALPISPARRNDIESESTASSVNVAVDWKVVTFAIVKRNTFFSFLCVCFKIDE